MNEEDVFEAVEVRGIHHEIIAQIRRLFLQNKLKPGDRLPTEQEMARQFGVSRGPIREALSALETVGLIERRKGSGSFLRKLKPGEVLAGLLPTKTDKELFVDLIEVRKVLESKAVELMIEKGTQEDLNNIKRAIFMLENGLNTNGSAVEADVLFHLYIAMASHNRILFEITKNIGEMLRDVREKTLKKPGRLEKCLEEHRDIFLALQERDIERAREAIVSHLDEVEELLDSI